MAGFLRADGNTLQARNANVFITLPVIVIRYGVDWTFLMTQTAIGTVPVCLGGEGNGSVFPVRMAAGNIYRRKGSV